MPLAGTLDTMQLSDLMQWIHASGKSGLLTVSLDLEDTYLVFRTGDLVALGSDDPLRLDIGQVLLARGMLTDDALQAATRKTRPGASVIDTLVADGTADDGTVRLLQREHAFATVLDLFFHEEGSFQFSTAGSSSDVLALGDLPQTSLLREPLGIEELMFEGIRRLDEWKRIREVFPNSFVVVRALGEQADNAVMRELVKHGQPISIDELCLHVSGSRFEVYRQLFEGYCMGLVGLDRMPTSPANQASLGPVEMLLENARVLMGEQQFDEARAVLSTVANLDPDNPVPAALLRQVREAQLEYLYQQIPPYRVPVLAVPREHLGELQLNPREMFLASRLNGRWDVATLVVATPLGELATLRTLRKFLHAGIIQLT